METADMVKVAVSAAPYSIDKPYSYLVPDALAAAAVPGVRVMVPFGRGNKESEGLILARVQEPKLPGSKAIRQILDPEPVLDKAGIDLALWMRGRYFCTVFEAVKTILPAGLWYGLREIWSLAMEPETARSAAVGIPGAWQVLDLLEKQGGKADIRVLRDALGDGAEKPLKAMKKAKILTCETDAKRKIADKSHRMVELAVNTEDAYALTEPKRRSAPARYEVVNFLATAGRIPAAEVSYYTGASARTLKTMEKAGLIAFSEEEELRVPSLDDVEPGPEIVLNEEQQRAFEEILGRVQAAKPSVTLLHGVTGSGKTQVYLRLVQETLALGKTAMVLVPEIVLTPQMMRKFSSYFGSRVAMLHSSLKMTERYDQWKRIRRGEVDVVLGTRSALFAPLKNLGLIIMDEEQEGSYQSENVPRYDAREVAKYLCVREKAALVLGSATPTVEIRLGGGTGKLSKGAAAAALQRKRLAGGPHCGSAAGDIERQPGPDQHPAAAGAGKKSGGGGAEYPVSEPPGQQPDAAVRRVRLCAPVPPVQHCHDLSFRQRAADVPLLRTLRTGGGHLPGMRRLDEACWRGYAKGGGGAAGAVPGGGHPADGCRYHRRGP